MLYLLYNCFSLHLKWISKTLIAHIDVHFFSPSPKWPDYPIIASGKLPQLFSTSSLILCLFRFSDFSLCGHFSFWTQAYQEILSKNWHLSLMALLKLWTSDFERFRMNQNLTTKRSRHPNSESIAQKVEATVWLILYECFKPEIKEFNFCYSMDPSVKWYFPQNFY